MGEGTFEVAQIREIQREVGRFGGIMRLLFIAEKTSVQGTETIAMTSEFEWQKHQNQGIEEDLERARRTLHNQILQALLEDGWEPIGTDGTGRVMALRRKLEQEDEERSIAERETEPLPWDYSSPWHSN